MLIVGGAAALTAITAYLTWHFVRQWWLAAKLRRTNRPAISDNRPANRPVQAERALDPVR
jgi:peptidoglycan/LPS O-acetylase OafA/YrhL